MSVSENVSHPISHHLASMACGIPQWLLEEIRGMRGKHVLALFRGSNNLLGQNLKFSRRF